MSAKTLYANTIPDCRIEAMTLSGIRRHAAAHGVERFVVYEFRATEKASDNREDHFGIVHADFTPKAAYRALADRAAKRAAAAGGWVGFGQDGLF